MMNERWLQVIGNKLFFNSTERPDKAGTGKIDASYEGGSTVLRLV